MFFPLIYANWNEFLSAVKMFGNSKLKDSLQMSVAEPEPFNY